MIPRTEAATTETTLMIISVVIVAVAEFSHRYRIESLETARLRISVISRACPCTPQAVKPEGVVQIDTSHFA
jgi:hypothetical protein